MSEMPSLAPPPAPLRGPKHLTLVWWFSPARAGWLECPHGQCPSPASKAPPLQGPSICLFSCPLLWPHPAPCLNGLFRASSSGFSLSSRHLLSFQLCPFSALHSPQSCQPTGSPILCPYLFFIAPHTINSQFFFIQLKFPG